MLNDLDLFPYCIAHAFFSITSYLIMVIVLTLTKKANKDILGDWVNSKILEIAFTFVHERRF